MRRSGSISSRAARPSFRQIQAATGGFFRETLAALWDLVWAGEVTNDTLRPVRAVVRPHAPGRARMADTPPEASGRWSLVRSYLTREPSPEERQAALAQSLLDRYGILVREAVHAEGVPGGWAALYPVLRAMEEAGTGRFVAATLWKGWGPPSSRPAALWTACAGSESPARSHARFSWPRPIPPTPTARRCLGRSRRVGGSRRGWRERWWSWWTGRWRRGWRAASGSSSRSRMR